MERGGFFNITREKKRKNGLEYAKQHVSCSRTQHSLRLHSAHTNMPENKPYTEMAFCTPLLHTSIPSRTSVRTIFCFLFCSKKKKCSCTNFQSFFLINKGDLLGSLSFRIPAAFRSSCNSFRLTAGFSLTVYGRSTCILSHRLDWKAGLRSLGSLCLDIYPFISIFLSPLDFFVTFTHTVQYLFTSTKSKDIMCVNLYRSGLAECFGGKKNHNHIIINVIFS